MTESRDNFLTYINKSTIFVKKSYIFMEMKQYKMPTGILLVYSYQESLDIYSPVLREKIENFIDLTKYRTEKNGVLDSAVSLKEEIFDIRLEFVKLFNLPNEYFKNLEDSISKKIWMTYSNPSRYKSLNEAIVICLKTYFKIVNPIISKVEKDFMIANKLFTSENVNYHTIDALVAMYPGDLFLKFKQWLDASLTFDFALVLSELILNKELKLKKQQIDVLIKLVKSSIEDFGFLSSLFGAWTPDEEDEQQIIRNMKIRLAANHTDVLSSKPYEKQSLKEAIFFNGGPFNRTVQGRCK